MATYSYTCPLCGASRAVTKPKHPGNVHITCASCMKPISVPVVEWFPSPTQSYLEYDLAASVGQVLKPPQSGEQPASAQAPPQPESPHTQPSEVTRPPEADHRQKVLERFPWLRHDSEKDLQANAPPPVQPATKPTHSCNQWSEVDAALALDSDDRLSLTLPREREEAVRRQFAAYANSLPHHDLTDFGQHVRITRVDEHFVYQVDLRFLTEQRTVRRQEKPYSGPPVPAAKTTEANIDVWSYRLPPPPSFQKATVEHAVEDSQVVRPCEGCGEQGSVPCDGCSGSRAVVCPKCRGSGANACGRCGGTTFFEMQTGTQQKWKKCDNFMCQGGYLDAHREHMCFCCNGKGLVSYEEPMYQMLPCPCGTGCVTCSTCQGHKQVQCPKCAGQGRLTCGKCQGATKLVSCLVIAQALTPGSVTGSAPSPAVENPVLQQVDGQADFTPYLQLSTTEIPSSVTFGKGSKGLQDLLTTSFAKCFDNLPKGSRIAQQALTVSRASILRVEYQHEGKDYVAWLIGRRMRVYAPSSPFTGVVEEKVEEAVSLWGQKKWLAAARVMHEATEFGKRDLSCQRAAERLAPQVPGLLRLCGKYYQFRHKALLVAASFVFVLGINIVTLAVMGVGEWRAAELVGQLDETVPVKATDIVQDFKRSKSAAKKKYDGKTFSVTGVVEQNYWRRSVQLQGGTSIAGSGNLSFRFGVEHERLVDRLSKGQTVTIRGRCEVKHPETAYLEFNECELVEERP